MANLDDDDGSIQAAKAAYRAAVTRLSQDQELYERLRANRMDEELISLMLNRAAEWHIEIGDLFSSSPGAEKKQHAVIADAADKLAELLENDPYREYLQTGDGWIDERTSGTGVPLDEYLRRFADFMRRGAIVDHHWCSADSALTESGRKTSQKTACIRWIADLLLMRNCIGYEYDGRRLPDRNVIVARITNAVLGLAEASQLNANDVTQALRDRRRQYWKNETDPDEQE